MNNTPGRIRKELHLAQPPGKVWRAIATSAALADWLHPNDFEPRVGHHFTFRVPPNPEVGFEGLTVFCKVLECDEPRLLVFSWSAGGPVVDTRVSFQLEPDGEGTRLLFEHSGFDLSQPWGDRALQGAEFGWASMLERLSELLTRPDTRPR